MVAAGNIHNTRILRFLLVLIVVILTIFIYASYSTNSTLTPTHIRAVPLPMAQQQPFVASAPTHVNRSSEFGLVTGGEKGPDKLPASKSNKREAVGEVHKKSAQHRLPTIDEDALLDGGGAGANAGDQIVNAESAAAAGAAAPVDEMLEEQQYIQGLDGIMGNINNSETVSSKQAASQQQPHQQLQQQQQQQLQQQPLDAEILIPTSNLQKFIENADKILKNMTSTNSSSPVVAVLPPSEQRIDKVVQVNDQPSPPEEVQINLLDSAEPQPSSDAVMRVKDANKAASALVVAAPKSPSVAAIRVATSNTKTPKNVDPSKGIPTSNIYENGHMDDEIDIERICPHNGAFLKLLILITSAQTHTDARMSIRQTWGHYGMRRDVSTAFILGRTTNETLDNLLIQENYMYGDLIRGNFIDSYNNLTLKTISSLEWIDLHCSRAKYILKTDDDMFINVPKLLTFLDKHKEKRVIYGRLAKKWKPIRNKKSKYYVSPDQFAATVFPAFTTGPAYVMTGDIVHELYIRSLETVYLKLEDVFTTGIVAQQLGIKRVQVNEFLNRRISFNPCNIRNAISVHMIKSNEQFDLWKKLLDQTTKCK
ncbi:uncharacterized protein LOC115631121 [Scaptodrosophila lebanonensis]|uniref:Uncharacterized protein LOC115631121 n=1 Tax=Drosophila lebanonensis TaxID=7225 RepID=A0A6J2U4Y2_DROLE|nr:uncharacterized protein LOC115631121 [Scaptodrosophila lebanonensis]XP_030383646.1 uncharacterized protein LOC115631121 [Scaptodrosophila lebanonensis]XP_030383647.1 uncharacterized protein LOC115631121 [Scaptodrosophila lebanonensis]